MKTKILITFVLFLLYLIHKPANVMASTIALEVKPTTVRLSIPQSGTEKTATFSLANRSNHAETIVFEVYPIEKVDKNTNRLIYQSKSQTSKAQQSFYKNAISFSVQGKPASGVILGPKQSRDVEVTIKKEADQSISEHYFTIGFISMEPNSNTENSEANIEANIEVKGGVGAHILVSMNEGTAETMIDDLNTTIGTSVPTVSFNLSNTNNKSVEIYGNISITNMFGSRIASYDTEAIYLLGKQKKEIIIPQELFTNTSLSLFSLGQNTVTVHLQNTDGKETLVDKKTYVYMPFLPLFILSLSIVTIIVLIKKVNRKLR